MCNLKRCNYQRDGTYVRRMVRWNGKEGRGKRSCGSVESIEVAHWKGEVREVGYRR